ncbi:MAG: permease [Anaerolineales bacterium]|uniref:DUF6803 family protein n=1 Tax=Candidatus Villigracilis vicinus TaxID=3140679 RepID=UPI0031349DA9|nr:permease [Anaerolineales bacterium]
MENSMTHYMELLATNQPWNLIIFMAIPVIFAEFIAVTELFILLNRGENQKLRLWNKVAGIIIGIYFTGIFFYLFFTAVVPLTTGGGWRGIADVIAVGFYLLGIVPLGGLALMGLGVIGKNLDDPAQLKLHATFVALFLVVAHIAMIFGMLDPTLFTGNAMPM